MEFIADKDTFKAVMFAKKMIGQGTPAGLAIYKAARYYGVDQADVAYYTRQKWTTKKRKG